MLKPINAITQLEWEDSHESIICFKDRKDLKYVAFETP